MDRNSFQLTLTFVIVLLLQVIIFDRICLFGVAFPIVYLYALLRLPITLAPSIVMLIGFFCGLIIDIFTNTLGMNAFAATIMTGCRKPIYKFTMPREDDLISSIPSSKNLGAGVYARYTIILTFIYCISLFIVEASSLGGFGATSIRIIASAILSSLIIIGIDSITNARKAL